MGAIERDGYIFEIEYSVVQQKAAIHVYDDGDFIQELPFTFEGSKPNGEQIEQVINDYVKSCL